MCDKMTSFIVKYLFSACILLTALIVTIAKQNYEEHKENFTAVYTNLLDSSVSEDKCNDIIPECASTGGTCKSFDEKDIVQCFCANDLTFVKSEGCKDICEDVTCFKGECYKETGKCHCPNGFNGEHCEILSKGECAKEIKVCDDTQGTCKIVNEDIKIECVCSGDETFDNTKGCHNPCENFICYNEGTCKLKNGKASCECPKGFTGNNCENLPKEECKNKIEKCVETNGICTSKDEENVSCVCKTGYAFVQDEGCQSYKEIEAINCKHVCGETDGVICVGNKRNIMQIKCACKDGDEAFHKEDKECKINYCKKICGTASNVLCSGNMFIEEEVLCSCRIDYQDFDEETKKCKEMCNDHNPCQNEGTCKGKEGSKTCECKTGTAGDLCDKIVACEEGGKYEKCKDGKGECIFKGGKPLCECTEEYYKLYESGGYCVEITTHETTLKTTSLETTTSSTSTQTSETTITALDTTFKIYVAFGFGVMGTVLTLLSIATIIFYRKLKKYRNHFNVCSQQRNENAPIEITGVERSENIYTEVNLPSIYKNQKLSDRQTSSLSEMPRNKIIQRVELPSVNNSFKAKHSSGQASYDMSNVHQQSGPTELSAMRYENKAYDLED